MSGTVLEARDLSAGYNAMPVVRGLNLRVDGGEVVALLGPNGAGKTTTLSTLSGALPLISGDVLFKGSSTANIPMHKRARRGLGYVSERRSVFTQLTVAGNLRVAGCDQEKALDLFPELRPMLPRMGGKLSGGEQQMLSLARALAREPDVVMADELSLGLAPLVVDRLLAALAEAARRGAGILVVEQHIQKALNIADRAYVIQGGRIILEGTASELAGRIDEIEQTYLTGSGPPNGKIQ
jgi:branched-chain amino acid transport system ATP-binding protein